MKHSVIYHVRGALQEEVDGSADILIAIMECYHALILVFPSNLHQLWNATNTHHVRNLYSQHKVFTLTQCNGFAPHDSTSHSITNAFLIVST